MDRAFERDSEMDAAREEWSAWLGDPTPDVDFRAIHEEHAAFVWSCLRRAGVSASSLDDAAQDVFLTAYRALPRYVPSGSMRAWLAGIARKIAFRYRRAGSRALRKHEAYREVSTIWGSSRERNFDDRLAVRQMLAQVLGELDEDRRLIFVLADVHGLSGKELAQALDLRPTTVDSRLRSARERVRSAFFAAMDGDPAPSASLGEAMWKQAVAEARAEEAPPSGWVARSWLLLLPKLPLAGLAAQMLVSPSKAPIVAGAGASVRALGLAFAASTFALAWPFETKFAAIEDPTSDLPERVSPLAHAFSDESLAPPQDLTPSRALASVSPPGVVRRELETPVATSNLRTGWSERGSDSALSAAERDDEAEAELEMTDEREAAGVSAALFAGGVHGSAPLLAQAQLGARQSVPSRTDAVRVGSSRPAKSSGAGHTTTTTNSASAGDAADVAAESDMQSNVGEATKPDKSTVYAVEVRAEPLLKDNELARTCLAQTDSPTSLIIATQGQVSKVDSATLETSLVTDLAEALPQGARLDRAFSASMALGELFVGQWRVEETGAVGWLYGWMEDGALRDLVRVDGETLEAWSRDSAHIAIVTSDEKGIVSRILDDEGRVQRLSGTRVHAATGDGRWIASGLGRGWIDESGFVDATASIPASASVRDGEAVWSWFERDGSVERLHAFGPDGALDLTLPARADGHAANFEWQGSAAGNSILIRSIDASVRDQVPAAQGDLFWLHSDPTTGDATFQPLAHPSDWEPMLASKGFAWLVAPNGLALGAMRSRASGELAVWSVDVARGEWTKLPVRFDEGVADLSIRDLDGAWSVRSERVWQEPGKMVLNREISTDLVIRGQNRSLHFQGESRAVTAFSGTSCVVIGGVSPGRLSTIGSSVSAPAMLVDWANGQRESLGAAQMVAVLSSQTY
jgi:RNA polymerase sigma-70 factor (ECF subfamily)